MFKDKELEALLRKKMPYGLMRTTTGKTIFFNRDYEALSILGNKEFDSIEIDYSPFYKVDNRVLLGEDGSVYLGTFYFLYTGDTAPFKFTSLNLLRQYLRLLLIVFSQYVDSVGNAYNNRTCTPSQSRKLKRMINDEKTRRI